MLLSCLYLMLIPPFIGTLDYDMEILEGWRLINAIITVPALYDLDNVLQLIWNSITAYGYAMTNHNLIWCNYQRILVLTKVRRTYWFLCVWWRTYKFSNLVPWCISFLNRYPKAFLKFLKWTKLWIANKWLQLSSTLPT